MALTAGSPIFKGKLAAVDTRWEIVSGAVDCRNSEVIFLKKYKI